MERWLKSTIKLNSEQVEALNKIIDLCENFNVNHFHVAKNIKNMTIEQTKEFLQENLKNSFRNIAIEYRAIKTENFFYINSLYYTLSFEIRKNISKEQRKEISNQVQKLRKLAKRSQVRFFS